MKRYSSPLIWTCAVALVAALSAGVGHAASPMVGKWKIEIDFAGTPVPADLEISENADGTLKGKLVSIQGELEIATITQDGNNIAFTQEVDMGGTPMTFNFAGTVEGDKVSGKLTSEMGEMAVTGGRAVDGGIAGTWDVVSNSQLGELKRTLIVKDDMTGTYASDEATWDIAALKVEGDAVTFDVTVDVQGQAMPLSFKGVLAGDALTGEFFADGSSVSQVAGKRAGGDEAVVAGPPISREQLVGKWNLEVDSPLGLLKHVLIVPADGAVSYDQDGVVSEVKDFKIEGPQASFGVNIQGYDVIFMGGLESDALKGDFHMDGNPVATVAGAKATE